MLSEWNLHCRMEFQLRIVKKCSLGWPRVRACAPTHNYVICALRLHVQVFCWLHLRHVFTQDLSTPCPSILISSRWKIVACRCVEHVQESFVLNMNFTRRFLWTKICSLYWSMCMSGCSLWPSARAIRIAQICLQRRAVHAIDREKCWLSHKVCIKHDN